MALSELLATIGEFWEAAEWYATTSKVGLLVLAVLLAPLLFVMTLPVVNRMKGTALFTVLVVFALVAGMVLLTYAMGLALSYLFL